MKTLLPLLFAFAAGCGASSSPPSSSGSAPVAAPTTADIAVDGYNFHLDYATNEAAAKLKYDGRWVMTTGYAGAVTAKGKEYVLPIYVAGDPVILCYFDESQQANVAALPLDHNTASGQPTVAVIGRIKEVRHGPFLPNRTQIVLEHCVAVPMPQQWKYNPPADDKK